MYAINSSEKYQIWANANLTNLPLGFKTYSDENYTITVSNVSGSETLILRDLSNNEEYSLVNNAVIEFTAAANSTIEDRFVINYQAPAPTYDAQVELNANGLATFSHHTLKLQAVEDGVKLYKGAISGETLALTQVSVVEAHQGVIVYGAANTTYHFNETTASADFAGNQLIPSCEWENRGTGDIYVLSGDALYLYEGDQFPANKAFLEIANQGPAPRRIRLVFDQATAIDNISVDNVKAEKVVENGQILIRRGNEVYNLQGQIVK
jgi:hypothetical protein